MPYNKRQSEVPSADRLCAAASAVLQALREVAREQGMNKLRAIYPPDLLGSAIQPACLADFTRDEVEHATEFLHRLGFLQKAA